MQAETLDNINKEAGKSKLSRKGSKTLKRNSKYRKKKTKNILTQQSSSIFQTMQEEEGTLLKKSGSQPSSFID